MPLLAKKLSADSTPASRPAQSLANPPIINDSDLCTKTIAELTDKDGNHLQILTLLDTSAIGKAGTFIKHLSLIHI
eukprot:1773396-Ditylum_brightwellii.AAC.1